MKHDEDQIARQLRELGDELPYTPPRADRMDELRASLGALPPPRFDRRRPWIIASAALAAVVLAAIALAPSVRAPENRAEIRAADGARFVHTRAAEGTPEIVQLSNGTVHIQVEPLASGERMVLRTLDAELEVQGTRFDVTAIDDRVSFVEVFEGVVELRRNGELPVLLRAGAKWMRPEVELPKKTEPEVVVAPPPPVVKKKKRSSEEVPPEERAFRDAWSAFARGDMEQAAELFADAEAKAPASSLAEDAAYGRALALERAGRRLEAIAEMERFLLRHPNSPRGDEVSVSLGWLLLDAGRIEEAKARFERASSSPVQRIQRSAQRGVEEAGKR